MNCSTTPPDRHSSGPRRITFDTNPWLCNLQCIMCEEHSLLRPDRAPRQPASRVMPIDIIVDTIAMAKPLGLEEIIPSTMGEPLLYPHFDQIIAACLQYKVKLNLTTNGTFPRLGPTRWAELIVPVASDVKISFNGSDPDTQESIMPGLPYRTAIQHMQAFLAARQRIREFLPESTCSVTMQVTFMKRNLEQMPSLVRLACEMGFDRVKGHHLWVHWDSMARESIVADVSAYQSWNAVVEQCHAIVEAHYRNTGKRVTLTNFTVLQAEHPHSLRRGPCPFLGREAWIDDQGRFRPCCAPENLRRQLGDFGSLDRTAIIDIWHSAAYQELCRSYERHPVCQQCVMRIG